MRLKGQGIRLAVACGASAAVLGPLIWLWQDSLLPETYSVMDMGRSEHGGHGAGRSVTSLIADPRRLADVSVTLTAGKERFRLPSGRVVDGFTLNGGSPGPVVRATVGQLVEVRLVNGSVPDGITLHWHGVDVPNAADGVAGVTQDAVGVGAEYVYRFVADQAGTFWYHSHQVSHEQVRGGLLGALVVTPPEQRGDLFDVIALVHLYGGVRTVNGHEGDVRVTVPPGARRREPLVGGLAQCRGRGVVRDRLRRRQSRHLDGPLPQPAACG